MIRLGKYRIGLSERLGFVPERIKRTVSGPVIWIHAVSVGEVLAIVGLAKELREEFPAGRVVISTTTHTGQKLARERFGERDVFFFPVDFAWAIRPYLNALKPNIVVLAETEFWPNFIHLSKHSGAHLVVANARISDRSLPRYQKFRGLLARVLQDISIFLCQSAEDARRLRSIGAPTDRVITGGNLKFDAEPPPDSNEVVSKLQDSVEIQGRGPIIVAGSTVAGEEELVIGAFRELIPQFPEALLVLAPRHKERFEIAAQLLEKSQLPFVRRSTLNGTPLGTEKVLLLDTIGELAATYSVADVAFVGGSLVPSGGHNILEPANFGVATIVGPHTENFRDIIDQFKSNNAVLVCKASDFAKELCRLLGDDAERIAIGERGLNVLLCNRGATERTIEVISVLLGPAQ